MKISSIRFTELPSGHSALPCFKCGAAWHSNRGAGLTPCNCIRFLWSSSELGEANLGTPADFDRGEFEDSYKRQHWSVYQEDEIVDVDLGSPDPYVLEQLAVSGVDEAIFHPEIPSPDSQSSTGVCIGLRHTKGRASRRKRPAAIENHAGGSVPLGHLLKAPGPLLFLAEDSLSSRRDSKVGWIKTPIRRTSAYRRVPEFGFSSWAKLKAVITVLRGGSGRLTHVWMRFSPTGMESFVPTPGGRQDTE